MCVSVRRKAVVLGVGKGSGQCGSWPLRRKGIFLVTGVTATMALDVVAGQGRRGSWGETGVR